MSTWKKSLSLIPPTALPPLLDGISSLTGVANSGLDVIGGVLDTASAFFVQKSDPSSLAAQALVQQCKDFISDVFSAGGYKLVVHPYIPGVGKGEGVFRSLSFPNCVKVICREFDDAVDSRRPVFSSGMSVEIITIIAGAPSPSLFASTLSAMDAFFSLKELRHALRRINQALELEKVRFVRKSGSRQPDWSAWMFRDFQQAAELEKAALAGVSMVDGYAKGADNTLDAAADLVAKKRSQLTRLQDNMNNASNMFSGGLVNSGVYTMYAKAQGSDGVKNELQNATNGAGHELSFCAGLSLVAPEPALSAPKEILQL